MSLYNIIQRARKNKPDYTNYLNEHFVYVYIGDYYIFGENSLKRIFGMDFSNLYSEFNDKEEIISTLTEKNFEKLEEHIQFRWIQFKDRKKAYYAISFEREAYANEKDLNYLKKRSFWSFFKYV